MRIATTPAAEATVRRVIEGGREDLVMVLSNGCCESTAPYLYDHYIPEPGSEPVGEIAGVPVLAPPWLLGIYGGEDTLVVDVEQGLDNDSFSLESDYDCRFVLRAPQAELRR